MDQREGGGGGAMTLEEVIERLTHLAKIWREDAEKGNGDSAEDCAGDIENLVHIIKGELP